MAIVHRLDDAEEVNPAGLGIQLARLVRLHAELALAEVRRPLTVAAVAVAVGLVALMASMSAAVLLIAAGVAPFFGGRWQHLAIAGGGVLLAAALAMVWSVWRLRRIALPHETLRSLTENWEWLVLQVRSRLTLR